MQDSPRQRATSDYPGEMTSEQADRVRKRKLAALAVQQILRIREERDRVGGATGTGISGKKAESGPNKRGSQTSAGRINSEVSRPGGFSPPAVYGFILESYYRN